jgi:phage repressor protein C with HTH and peptisase S24 domain
MIKFGCYKVAGDSMLPSFCCGDFVIIYRRANSIFKQDDVVVVEHAEFGKIIKRIVAVESEGNLLLAGDNLTASTDTLTLGSIPPKQVLGRVVGYVSRPARKR